MAGTVSAAPAQANPVDDAFLGALRQAGVHFDSSEIAVGMAKEVCNRLVDPAKSFAYASSAMSGNGMPPQIAAFAAGIAVKVYCPQMMRSMGEQALFRWVQVPI